MTPKDPQWTPLWLSYKCGNQWKGSRQFIYNQFNWLILCKHWFRLIWRKIPRNVHFRPNQSLEWLFEPPINSPWSNYKCENQWKESMQDIYNQFNWLILFKHWFRLIICRKIPRNVHFQPNQPLKWPDEPPVTTLWVCWNLENWLKGLTEAIFFEYNWLITFRYSLRLKNGPKISNNAFFG